MWIERSISSPRTHSNITRFRSPLRTILGVMPIDPREPPGPERAVAYVLLTALEHLELRDALFPAAEGVGLATLAQARGLLDLHGAPTSDGHALTDPVRARDLLIAWRTIGPSPAPSPAPRRAVAVSEIPDARTLQLTRSARALFDRLREEPVGDWSALLQECREHAAAFERGLATNEFLPVEEARRLVAGIAALHDRGHAHRDPSYAERLTWVAARYFVIKHDGTEDFAVVGLDDDVAVFNAVCQTLGYEDLRI
jgi:hypothetical protein